MDKVSRKITLLNEFHNDWIQVCRSYGARDYAEDLVQDMYIRLMRKTEYLDRATENDEVQKGYVFFILRTMLINKQNKDSKSPISFSYDNDGMYEGLLFKIDDNEEYYNKLALENLYELIDKEIETWRWYDRKIFQIYRDVSMSIRKISADTKISYVSIFRTLKTAKEKILLNLWEEYEKYKQGNYERN